MKIGIAKILSRLHSGAQIQADLRREYEEIRSGLLKSTPDNPAIHGYKVYSQFDEDGIIDYIFNRLGRGSNIFIEIGCGNGTENNTHKLALSGWRGLWIDADRKNIQFIRRTLPANNKLIICCERVSAANVCTIVGEGLAKLGSDVVDFLSIDIDGNDLYVLLALMQKFKPRLLCVEYNAKFPPPMNVCVSESHAGWTGDDYYGASLACFAVKLSGLGYKLVACGLSGANAFFVREIDAGKFPNFTQDELFQPARHYLINLESGHLPSLKFLADALTDSSAKESEPN